MVFNTVSSAVSEADRRVRMLGVMAASFVGTLAVGAEQVMGWVTGLPGGAVDGVVGLFESVGPGIVAGVIALVAGKPLIIAAVGGLLLVALVNPGDMRDEITWLLKLLVLAVLGYVVAETVGGAVLEMLPALALVLG